MIRPTPRSATALLLALLFLLATAGEGLGASPCSHHEASVPHGEEHAPGDDAHAHGHHGQHAADSRSHSDTPDHGAVPCTCIGGCLPGVSGKLPPPEVRLAFAPAAIRAAPLVAPAEAQPRPLLLPHVLPFALAPPAA